jgi:DNA-binding LytR/AlgR family response regulator
MNVIVVEDEKLAAERIQLLLKEYDDSISICGNLESIEETVNWLQTKAHPDLMLMDIHLSDGNCFEIFNRVKINKPIIFTTAYDNHAIDAFNYFSIDYILKPVTASALANAIQKYKMMANAFQPYDYSLLSSQLKENLHIQYKERFLAKVGCRTFFVLADDVVCFLADNKIVQVLDKNNNRLNINYSMEKLESLLDPRNFFRINRKIIIHSKYIDLAKPYYNNRLKLVLKGINPESEIIISREKVSAFKKWAEG